MRVKTTIRRKRIKLELTIMCRCGRKHKLVKGRTIRCACGNVFKC